jgi:hypothetical protein
LPSPNTPVSQVNIIWYMTHTHTAFNSLISSYSVSNYGDINPLNAELNPICHLLALLGAHHILYVSRIRVKQNQTL